MTIIINVVIFLAIISYVVFTLFNFFKKAKAGKCSSCGSKRGCHTEKKTLWLSITFDKFIYFYESGSIVKSFYNVWFTSKYKIGRLISLIKTKTSISITMIGIDVYFVAIELSYSLRDYVLLY